jgi:hypothetical protein
MEGLGMENVVVLYDHLKYFKAIWNILRPFGIFYGRLVKFVAIWYIFPVLVCLDQEIYGDPAFHNSTKKTFQALETKFSTLIPS